MRLEREGPPDPADRALAHPGRGRHRPRRPMRRVGRLLLECLDDHPLHVVVADRARLARPRLVMQAGKAAAPLPPPPLSPPPALASEKKRASTPRSAVRLAT